MIRLRQEEVFHWMRVFTESPELCPSFPVCEAESPAQFLAAHVLWERFLFNPDIDFRYDDAGYIVGTCDR